MKTASNWDVAQVRTAHNWLVKRAGRDPGPHLAALLLARRGDAIA